jgi:hypothetical protein
VKASNLAGALGKGLVAGFAGTAAMTASSTFEQHLRKREASQAPAKATAKVLGIAEFESDAARERFSFLSHWGYGTAWGVVRAMLAATGLPPKAATAAHLAAVWGNEQVMLPALDVAPPITMWGGKEIAIDACHHAVYATATGAAYELLSRNGKP